MRLSGVSGIHKKKVYIYMDDHIIRGRDLKRFLLEESSTLETVLQTINENGKGIAFIEDGGKLKGVVTDGDVRRALLKGYTLGEAVSLVANRNYHFVEESNYGSEELKRMFLENGFGLVTVISNENLIGIADITKLLLYEFNTEKSVLKGNAPIPLVIMAGGKGTRMKPFTHILPKPLVPIKGKPVIELIIEKFKAYNAADVFISVNHKAKIIKSYFEESSQSDIKFIEEKQPLGTAGAMYKLKNDISGDFFLSNADIIVDADYEDALRFHKKGKFSLTLIAAKRRIKVPYGVCSVNNDFSLEDIHEKPENDYTVNTGVYIINSGVLELIPEEKFYDITDLICKLKEMRMSVGVYTVPEDSFIDIGQWEEYRKFTGENIY